MSNETPSQADIAAIIVTYRPEPQTLGRMITTLIDDDVLVIVIDNGGGREALPAATLLTPRVTYLDMQRNAGIGAAINAGFQCARNAGARYVITFDQDSAPSNGMVRLLAAEFQRQVDSGVDVAAVGPCFVDNRQQPPMMYPFIRLRRLFGSSHHYCASGDALIPVDLLITSGCLTSLDVIERIGGMDSGIFVDYTDIEWSFRALSKGLALFGVCRARMAHELGAGRVRRVFGLHLYEYGPVRRYFYARNTVHMMRLPYVPMRWKMRLLLGCLIRVVTLAFAPRRRYRDLWPEWSMSLRGIFDGVRGRLGPAPD